jgi:RNA polymerase sigma-70 factor (ECF subfamily)
MANSKLHDEPLFDDVLEKYYGYIFKFVVKQSNNIEDAKDLTQEIFIKAYNNFGKYDSKKASVKTWLFAIANNHIINYWKSSYIRNKSQMEIDIEMISSDIDILESIIQDEDIKLISFVMDKKLSKRNIKIMNLYFFSNLKPKEIAEVLNIKSKTVSNVVSLSIRIIKEELEDNRNGKI